jgi:hypothetical protein
MVAGVVNHGAAVQVEGFWMRRVADAVGAASEVMFPGSEAGAPDWQETSMVARTVEYLGELPPESRRLVMLMFVAVEFGAPFLGVGPGRFSRVRADRRLRGMTRWKHSRLWLLRVLAEALKAQLCMMYLSHPAVQRFLGAWKSCARPGDVLDLPVREDALSGTTADGMREGAA